MSDAYIPIIGPNDRLILFTHKDLSLTQALRIKEVLEAASVSDVTIIAGVDSVVVYRSNSEAAGVGQ